MVYIFTQRDKMPHISRKRKNMLLIFYNIVIKAMILVTDLNFLVFQARKGITNI
jgi:hypothetical protein